MHTSSDFKLQNIKCASCVSKIQTKLAALPFVKDARINLLEKTLRVEYITEKQDAQIIAAVASLGYSANQAELVATTPKLWLSVATPLAAGLILMFSGMLLPPGNGGFNGQATWLWGNASAAISLLLILVTGKAILKSGLAGLRNLLFNMHSLITLGVSAAWIYSATIINLAYLGYAPGSNQVYFESALIIIGLINLGAFLEDKAKTNTTKAIKALTALQPAETTIISDSQERRLNTNLLRTEHIVKIRPGERIPADGKIVSGSGYLDESLLSGEALAVHKVVGDSVIAGSVNTTGAFLFQVSKVGGNTLLAGIIDLVKNAQMAKPALAKLADQVTQIFVPAIMLIALGSSLIWWLYGPEPRFFHALSIFMTVLIIACPCSVGLAIPVALMVGVGKSASQGILIRDPSCLNAIARLNYVLLDKTGTITQGKPQLVSFHNFVPTAEDQLLGIIKAMENHSEHPLGAAILAYKPQIKPFNTATNFNATPGGGISAQIAGEQYYLGNWSYIQQHIKNGSTSPKLNQITVPDGAPQYYTQVFLASETQLLARLEIADALRADSATAIAKLKQAGIKVAMLTGDNSQNAAYIAGQMAIDQVYAECKPQDKIRIVRELQREGQVVAFVGDGINDAPSLTQADVGIAIGGGTDIAMQSAHITLMHPSLFGISRAIKIGSAINLNMRQNLFGAFIYNTLAVFIAAGVFYPLWGILLNPIIASIAMSASSLSVIFNALRLRNL